MKRPEPAETNADEIFQSLARRLLEDGRVSQSRMFGASGLSVNKKYFAMLYKGNLVVKLPERRASRIVAGGSGEPFDPGHGRVMREWVAVNPAKGKVWQRLALEAMNFVASATPEAAKHKATKGRALGAQTSLDGGGIRRPARSR